MLFVVVKKMLGLCVYVKSTLSGIDGDARARRPFNI